MDFYFNKLRLFLGATVVLLGLVLVSCGDRLAQSGWSTGAIGILSDSTYAVVSQYSEVWEERRINIFGDAYDHIYHKQIKITVKNIDTREIYWEKEFPWSGRVTEYYLADSTFILEDTNILFWTVGDDQPRKSVVNFKEVEDHINLSGANLQMKGDSILAFLPDEYIFIDTVSGKVGKVSEAEIPAWMRECGNVVYQANSYLCVNFENSSEATKITLLDKSQDTVSEMNYPSEVVGYWASLKFVHGKFFATSATALSRWPGRGIDKYALFSWKNIYELNSEPFAFVEDFKRDDVYRDFNGGSYE